MIRADHIASSDLAHEAHERARWRLLSAPTRARPPSPARVELGRLLVFYALVLVTLTPWLLVLRAVAEMLGILR
jgi:hypothetical protein